MHPITSLEVRGKPPVLDLFVRIVGKAHRSPGSSSSSQRATYIHILDDDSLLKIFSYYRVAAFDYHEYGDLFFHQWRVWEGGCWWYELVRVCRRWRCLIVGSPFRLGVGLLYSRGASPVARMLAHEPRLPLGVNCSCSGRIGAKEKRDIKLALQYRDRVRSIWLEMLVQDMVSLIMGLDGEFPMLEHLGILPSMSGQTDTSFTLPPKFQALQEIP